MYAQEKADKAAANAKDVSTTCVSHLPYPSEEKGKAYYGNVLQVAEDIAVSAASTEGGVADVSVTAKRAHPEPHRRYLITARALTGAAGLSSIVSGVLTGIGMTYTSDDLKKKNVYEDMTPGICVMLNIMVCVECVFCVTAMASCFGLLFTRPHAVLIRSKSNHSLNCLRASVMILFLFVFYSIAASGYCASVFANPAVFIVSCISSAVRCVSLLWFFILLNVNSKVGPSDGFY